MNARRDWFWTSDQDLRTSRAFAFLMMLEPLADTRERELLPLVTNPAR